MIGETLTGKEAEDFVKILEDAGQLDEFVAVSIALMDTMVGNNRKISTWKRFLNWLNRPVFT